MNESLGREQPEESGPLLDAEKWKEEVEEILLNTLNLKYYENLLTDPEIGPQIRRVEDFVPANLRHFYADENRSEIKSQIAESRGKIIVAMHPLFLDEHLDESLEVLDRLINTKSSRVPPLLIIEGVSSLQETDSFIGNMLIETSRPVYYLPSMDYTGAPLPPGVSVQDLIKSEFITIREETIDGKQSRTLSITQFDALKEESVDLAQIGTSYFAQRVGADGATSAILGGMNMHLEYLDSPLTYQEPYIQQYANKRIAAGAKQIVIPSECVGMMYKMLGQHMDVQLSNFTRPYNRNDLEAAEQGQLSI